MAVLFCIDLNADIEKRSGIQSKFLDGDTSTKCQKLAEPAICLEMTDRKIKEKTEERLRTDGSACRVNVRLKTGENIKVRNGKQYFPLPISKEI